MARFDADEILAQLDACAVEYTFPMLDHGYVYLVDTRLHAYRDEERWALMIEVVGYNPRGGGLDDTLYLFGNCLARAPGIANEDFLHPIDDDVEDPDSPEDARPGLRQVSVRGQVIELPVHRDPWPMAELFRSLVPGHRELLFATEQQLRARVPADLPQILQLEEWHHPDVVADERPSQSETFRALADVLVSGDPGRYRPTQPPNTHWSNWPDGGSL
jgi:hypothetical protein